MNHQRKVDGISSCVHVMRWRQVDKPELHVTCVSEGHHTSVLRWLLANANACHVVPITAGAGPAAGASAGGRSGAAARAGRGGGADLKALKGGGGAGGRQDRQAGGGQGVSSGSSRYGSRLGQPPLSTAMLNRCRTA